MQAADHQRVRVPLDHHVRVTGQPDRAVFGCHAIAVLQHHIVPFFVGVGAGLAELVRHADSLYRVMLREFPLQVVGCDKAAQTGVKRPDVVVLQVHLDKGFPVVIALVQVHFVQLVAGKVQVGVGAELGHLGRNVPAIVFKHQPVPAGSFVAVQIKARVNFKVRGTDQLARGVVGPAVQRADDVAAGVAATLQHGGLAVPADVGDQLDAGSVSDQRTAFAFVGQGIKVAQIGHRQFVAEIAWPARKQFLLFPLVQAYIKIAGNRKLAGGLQQAKA